MQTFWLGHCWSVGAGRHQTPPLSVECWRHGWRGSLSANAPDIVRSLRRHGWELSGLEWCPLTKSRALSDASVLGGQATSDPHSWNTVYRRTMPNLWAVMAAELNLFVNKFLKRNDDIISANIFKTYLHLHDENISTCFPVPCLNCIWHGPVAWEIPQDQRCILATATRTERAINKALSCMVSCKNTNQCPSSCMQVFKVKLFLAIFRQLFVVWSIIACQT